MKLPISFTGPSLHIDQVPDGALLIWMSSTGRACVQWHKKRRNWCRYCQTPRAVVEAVMVAQLIFGITAVYALADSWYAVEYKP